MIIKGTNLFLWIGPVRAGKTTKLHEVIAKSDEDIRILYVNSAIDTRTGREMSTHSSVIKQAETPNVTYLKVHRLEEVEISGYKKVLIDEGQFFPDLIDVVETWYGLGILDEIHIAGLDTTWERKPFLDIFGRWQILHLTPLATKVEKITARCKACRDESKKFGIVADVDAPFSGWVKRGIDDLHQSRTQHGINNIDVTGQYIPLCPFHWTEFMRHDRVYPIPGILTMIGQNSLRRTGSEYVDDDLTESSETDSIEDEAEDDREISEIEDVIKNMLPFEYQEKVLKAIDSVKRIKISNHTQSLSDDDEEEEEEEED